MWGCFACRKPPSGRIIQLLTRSFCLKQTLFGLVFYSNWGFLNWDGVLHYFTPYSLLAHGVLQMKLIFSHCDGQILKRLALVVNAVWTVVPLVFLGMLLPNFLGNRWFFLPCRLPGMVERTLTNNCFFFIEISCFFEKNPDAWSMWSFLGCPLVSIYFFRYFKTLFELLLEQTEADGQRKITSTQTMVYFFLLFM